MDKICAVIDVQGFQFPDRFVPREIAIISDTISQCQELNPQLNWRELSELEQGIVLQSTKLKHGLHFCPFNPVEHCFLPTPEEIHNIIKIWYEMIATEDKQLFAYKNQQMGRILEEFGVPSLNLDDKKYNFPKYEALQDKYGDNYICAYHKKPSKAPQSKLKYTCAYRKANHLYREIKERLLGDMDWNNM